MSDSYLDAISAATSDIREIQYSLAGLAESFYETGNDKLYERLNSYSMMLHKAEKAVNNAVSMELNKSLDASYQSTANMVKACLSMSLIKEVAPTSEQE